MASKSQTYFNNISPTKRDTISIIIDACKEMGITSQIFQAGLCAIVSKESDFVPKGEGSYSTSSADRIRSVFGKRFDKYTNAQIDQIKLDDKKFFSIVYASNSGNGDETSSDGWLFRGRGFNQLTFRGNYKAIGKNIGADLENNPELMERIDIAAKALVQYYVSTFDMMKTSLLNQYDVDKKSNSVLTMNGIKDIATAVRILYQATAGIGKKHSGTPVGLYFDMGVVSQSDGDLFFPNDDLGGFTKARNRAPGFYKLITGTQPPQTSATQSSVSDIQPIGNQTNDQSNGQSPPTGQESESNGRDIQNNSSGNVDIVIPGLTNVFPPTIKIDPIKFNVKGESKSYKKEMVANMGWKPFVWYNGYQISEQDISYFALYHDGLLPAITIIFNDTMNLMRDKAFPLDDTKIKIFLSSRSKSIRHILLEFKIKNFSINGQVFTIIGTLNVNGLLIKNYKAYSKKTSFSTIQDVCREIGLGFNSNISDSGDRMTWINPGLKVYDFLGEVLQNAYISDEGFAYGYIDYYYNFNYVDIEKELSRDNTEDKGIDTSGLTSNITGDNNKIYSMALTNDKSAKESDKYISEYKILNNSTAVSIYRGYLNISKFYDSSKKEFLIFDVDSITSEGNKTIIMKGSPQDDVFYKENHMSTYVGKIDDDNSHVNYNYSSVHNSQNIEDLQKIGIKITLPNPNYNLYRFQKVLLLITNLSATPGNNIKNDRISGNWFIVDIKIVYTEGKIYQEISLIKRELDISPEEMDAEESLNTESNPVGNNPIEKTTNPVDLSGTDVIGATTSIPLGATPSTINDTVPPPPPGKYNLEYLVDSSMMDNSGNVRKIVVIDNQPVDETVGNSFIQMRDAADASGIKMSIISGFQPSFGTAFDGKTSKNRTITISTQESIRRDKSRWILSERSKYKSDDDYVFNAPSGSYNPATPPPGQSSHGSGIALDLSTGSRVAFSKVLNSDVYTWLVKNSWKYGFIRTVNTEEWHFEYRPNEANQGPYVRVAGNNGNLFYSDLGLDKIRIS